MGGRIMKIGSAGSGLTFSLVPGFLGVLGGSFGFVSFWVLAGVSRFASSLFCGASEE